MHSFRVLLLGVLTAFLLVAATLTVPTLRWRVQLLGLYVTGEIPDFDWDDLIAVMLPGSPQQSARLAETRNPYAIMRNPDVSTEAVASGAHRYQAECAVCHGDDRRGTRGAPSLVDGAFRHGASDWALFRTIRHGIPAMGMPAHPLSAREVWQVVAFLRSGNGGPAGVPEPDRSTADALARIAVPYADIVAASATEADWLTYAGSYSSHRHTGLTTIDPGNVAQLALRWIYQVPGDAGRLEASAIVRDGVMFLTAPANVVLALDAVNGRELWRYERPPPQNLRAGEFGVRANRGVALLDDRLFVATADARLVALSARTGTPLWEVVVEDERKYKITSAPLVYRDLVVTGMGTQGGGRGAIVAYGVADGVERWRFHTIPGPGEPGHETWSGESWREGGAPPWLTGSYDPANDLLIWGVGNPKPDYEAAARAGDNLYSNAVVALRGKTGELVWHFQFTPGDDHDWDSAQSPLLVDFRDGDTVLPRVLWANRNGFYYVLDRRSGAFITAKPFIRQTWTAGLDAAGRPQPPGLEQHAGRRGAIVYPGNMGGTNWWAPSFDPERSLVFVPILEQGMVFFRTSQSWPRSNGQPLRTGIRALDARTGQLIWETLHAERLDRNETGGVMSTRSGLVFGSDKGSFFALDSVSGRQLWSVETGGLIAAPPVSYQVQDEQYVLTIAGGNVMAFALPGSDHDTDIVR